MTCKECGNPFGHRMDCSNRGRSDSSDGSSGDDQGDSSDE